MSQQGGRPARHEDDWWGQLYDDATEDTGPTAAPDSLEDRFASAKSTVTGRPRGPEHPPGETAFRETAPRDPEPWDLEPRDSEPWTKPQEPSPDPAAEPPVPPQAFAPPEAPPDFPSPEPPALTDPHPTAGLPTPTGPDHVGLNPTGLNPTGLNPTGLNPTGLNPTGPDHVGSGPPTYDPEPTALPGADPDELGELVADTVLDGARYGVCTVRAVSMRGDSARYRGEPRRDALLTARFGAGEQALLLVAMATGARATPGAHRAAVEACRWIGQAVGRSHRRLAEDIRTARRGELKSGLHRLTDRSLGKLRAGAVERDLDPEEYTASLRCLLLPADPGCRTRVFFGVGEGGLFRLRDGAWQDIEPQVSPADTAGEPVVGFGGLPPAARTGSPGAPGAAPLFAEDDDRLTMDLGIPTPPSPYETFAQAGRAGAAEPPRDPFLFRASVARPGDVLVMCSGGLADPLRGEPALCAYLARRWSRPAPPGLAAFLADAQVRVKGYADDRTAAAVWEA
ncbi:protein phosphatase 2C domain-containing protein [Streptomyces sp. NPDC048297]|uniref:protein phosphatase 2C domain-containing protein n=1 Tax=Streptomyces sp. NPDC048297 TaxID=3365531 RepID=UPI003721AE8C